MRRPGGILLRRPLAGASVLVLVILYGTMILAEFCAPYRAGTVFREHAYHPPNLRFYSRELGFRPQIQKHVLIDESTWRYAPVRGEYVPIRFFTTGSSYRLAGVLPGRVRLFGTDEAYDERGADWEQGGRTYPVFLMGADNLGRDLFSRILYGSRISLTIGFIGISISLSIAIALGGLAGYYGGWIDWLIMRIAEFVILIPGLYLILFLRSLLSRELDSGQSFMLITVILSFVGWPGSARLIRGLVHSIKREDFVVNARLESIPPLVIIFRHIIPQMSSILIVSVTLGIPGFILGETVLSYLGLGIVDPAVSWGSLLNREISTLANLRNFPWFLYPGLFLLLATLAFNFIGDLLRDLLDPYHRERPSLRKRKETA
ncbi:ABC transporter permease [Alkalispirochaeta sphaeroplastigenens]|uniref:ABC transporter permease n=1 Tax=Alkalispirochaeta sphaeroplastigenens TaxID=1187066 RepID=UPI000CDB6705|nr:ABC transporter permease [Alkalispirochaeta sphaeroplastigenens]